MSTKLIVIVVCCWCATRNGRNGTWANWLLLFGFPLIFSHPTSSNFSWVVCGCLPGRKKGGGVGWVEGGTWNHKNKNWHRATLRKSDCGKGFSTSWGIKKKLEIRLDPDSAIVELFSGGVRFNSWSDLFLLDAGQCREAKSIDFYLVFFVFFPRFCTAVNCVSWSSWRVAIIMISRHNLSSKRCGCTCACMNGGISVWMSLCQWQARSGVIL